MVFRSPKGLKTFSKLTSTGFSKINALGAESNQQELLADLLQTSLLRSALAKNKSREAKSLSTSNQQVFGNLA
jgi:hypothetical protein